MESPVSQSSSEIDVSPSNEIMQRFSYVVRTSISIAANAAHKAIPINGVIFDLDGTLTIPVLNFKELRQKINCLPPPVDILEFIRSKPEEEKSRLLKIVEDFEDEGNRNMKLQPGLHNLLKFLSENELKKAVVTRNARPCVEMFLTKLGNPSEYGGPFSHLLTRDFTPSKPDPASIHHICKEWAIPPQNAIMVGDHIHDITCGKTAGAVTILLNNPKNGAFKAAADFSVDSLDEIMTLLQSKTLSVQRQMQASQDDKQKDMKPY